jgi:hypothetical protein
MTHQSPLTERLWRGLQPSCREAYSPPAERLTALLQRGLQPSCREAYSPPAERLTADDRFKITVLI